MVSQDNHFTVPFAPYAQRQDDTWERPSIIDFGGIRREVSEKKKVGPVILEGHLVANDAELVDAATMVIILDLPRDVCRERRVHRRPRPAADIAELAKHYDGVVWPSYLKYGQPALRSLAARCSASGVPMLQEDDEASEPRSSASEIAAAAFALLPEHGQERAEAPATPAIESSGSALEGAASASPSAPAQSGRGAADAAGAASGSVDDPLPREDRVVVASDALAWLRSQQPTLGNRVCVVTSLPDRTELRAHYGPSGGGGGGDRENDPMPAEAYGEWLASTAELIVSRLDVGCAAVFYQTDTRADGIFVDKAHHVGCGARAAGGVPLFHKVRGQRLAPHPSDRLFFLLLVCLHSCLFSKDGARALRRLPFGRPRDAPPPAPRRASPTCSPSARPGAAPCRGPRAPVRAGSPTWSTAAAPTGRGARAPVPRRAASPTSWAPSGARAWSTPSVARAAFWPWPRPSAAVPLAWSSMPSEPGPRGASLPAGGAAGGARWSWCARLGPRQQEARRPPGAHRSWGPVAPRKRAVVAASGSGHWGIAFRSRRSREACSFPPNGRG